MTRYRKSIHQTLQEVAEWEAPKEPEVIVEEAPIPTETGRELLKKRIAHRKIEKKEIKYYPMGDVFKGKLQKTTQHLKEALELDDELDEAVKWEVKVSGLPVFYSDGKSKGAVRQMLRKLLKHPDDIQSINRVTSAELKKIRRGQIAGDEPGDEDEDKNPVGPSYNEEQELDELSPELAKRAYTKSRYNRQIAFNKADETDRIANVKKQDRQAKKFAGYAAKKEEDEMAIMSLDHNEAPRKLKLTQQGLEAFKQSRDEAFEGPFSAPGSGSIARPRKAKAGDENKSIEQQMSDARKESLAFQENEWDTMWKNAAKERPKMSFKQATEFVDEVGLDKKEKKDALKNAKKWLK